MTDTPIHVLIPTPLRRFTDGEAKIAATGTTVSELLDDIGGRFPGLADRIREPDGSIRRFVNVFVNGDNVRDGVGDATPLKPGDEVGIIPAMAGGSGAVRQRGSAAEFALLGARLPSLV